MEHYAPAQQVFAAGLLFARVGAIIMLIPGIGETFIPVRVRMAFAFLLALMLFPLIGPSVPAIPADAAGLGLALIKESLIGLMIGTILRVFMASLSTAGEIMSIQSTLSFSQTANPTQAQPSTSIASFLGMLGIVLILTTNLHYMFLSAIVRSYTLFPFARDLPLHDAVALEIQTVSRSFALGFQLAAPIVAFSLIFNIAAGLVGRVMPAFQIYFVTSPLMVLFSLSILALSLGVIGMVWLDHYRDVLAIFG